MYRGTSNDHKNLREKMCHDYEQNLETYGACQHKTSFSQILLINDDLINV